MISKNLKIGVLAAIVTIYGMQAAEPADTTHFRKKDKNAVYNNAILAINNDKQVGEIKYSVSQCWIGSLEVSKEYQRKGIGSQLFKRAINEMDHCETIKWAALLNSMDFYLKHGARIDTQSQCYADRILWQGANTESICFKDATETERTKYVNYLHKLNKADPTATSPHVSMLFENKKQK